MNVYEKKIAELERANAELRKKIISAEKYDEGGSKTKINDKMIIKCNNAEEYSWLIKELDKEDIFIFAIDPEHCMGKPEIINGREVNWDNKSYEKWFHDRRYFNIRSDFTLVNVMYQDEAIRLKIFSPDYSIIGAKELMEEKEMNENVKYTDVYKKEVKYLVRTDITPWENCGVIGTNPYKEAITDLEGRILKVGDYVKVIDIRNERNRIVTSIIVDIGNRLVPYCNKDYDGNDDILLIKVGEYPTYSHTIDPEKKEPRFVVMDRSEFDKQALAYYKAQYEDTLSKLEVLQKKYDDLEKTNELLKRKIEKRKSHMNTTLMKQEEARESIIPPNKIVVCRTKEECKWFIEEMEKIGNDNFYKFICAHDHVWYITKDHLNDIFEESGVTSVLFYFSYDTNPFRAYYYDHDTIDIICAMNYKIIEASNLMKQEENKDED